MRLIAAYRKDKYKGRDVPCYADSYVREFKAAGVEVLTLGENQDVTLDKLPTIDLSKWDYLIDIDNGRNPDGNLTWVGPSCVSKGPKWAIKTAVIFTDSHGQPTLHHRMAPFYTHVFFAVWSRRDIFTGHKSAHFLPNATDLEWFNLHNRVESISKDFGFFGSKNGLDRADPMIEICNNRGWTYDVRQLAKTYRPKWPDTADAMKGCRFLFNHGQKHDINLRIFESMAVNRPLICDLDSESGLDKLFEPYKHFVPYQTTYEGLEEAMSWVVNHPKSATIMAARAYDEVTNKHLIKHRVVQMLEIMV